MDDAALSVGGTLLAMRGGSAEVTVLSVVGPSSFDATRGDDRFEADDATARRREEALRAAAMLGAAHLSLDVEDALLRFRRWHGRRAPDLERRWLGWQTFGPEPDVLARVEEGLFAALSDGGFDEVWGPMGLGDHVDHACTRDALLRAVARLEPGRLPVRLYEDLPYSSWNPGHAATVAGGIAGYGWACRREAPGVSWSRAEKARLLACYASQLGPRDVQRNLDRPEVTWSLHATAGRPRVPVDAVELAREHPRFVPLVETLRRGVVPHVAMLLLGCPSSPRTLTDAAIAVRHRAHLRLFATRDAAADVEACARYVDDVGLLGEPRSWSAALRACHSAHHVVLCGPPQWRPSPQRAVTSMLQRLGPRETLFARAPGTSFRVLRRDWP